MISFCKLNQTVILEKSVIIKTPWYLLRLLPKYHSMILNLCIVRRGREKVEGREITLIEYILGTEHLIPRPLPPNLQIR